MPFVGRRLDALRENSFGAVLPALKLIADDGELGEKILPLDEAVDEPVALEMDGEVEVFVAGREGFEVVRAVDVRRAVEAGTVITQRLRHLREGGRPLEDEVLEEVGHSRFAVALVARADEDRHVDRDGRPRRIGEEDEPGAVVEDVLGHPFDGSDRLRRCRGERGGEHGDHGEEGGPHQKRVAPDEGGTGEKAEHGEGSFPARLGRCSGGE